MGKEESTTKTPLSGEEEDLVFAYTRAQALADGVLVDVTGRAREAGFVCPVALTATLWADIHAIPRSKNWEDVNGRLWDVLFRGQLALRRSKGSGPQLHYRLILHVGRRTYYAVKLVCGPGDAGEFVVTLMRPGED